MLEQQKELLELHKKLDQDPDSVSDKEIKHSISRFNEILTTNIINSAQAWLTAVAPICNYKEHLAAELLTKSLDYLLLIGIDEEKEVIEWISDYLEVEHKYMIQLNEIGERWIKESLLNDSELINKSIQLSIDKMKNG